MKLGVAIVPVVTYPMGQEFVRFHVDLKQWLHMAQIIFESNYTSSILNRAKT